MINVLMTGNSLTQIGRLITFKPILLTRTFGGTTFQGESRGFASPAKLCADHGHCGVVVAGGEGPFLAKGTLAFLRV